MHQTPLAAEDWSVLQLPDIAQSNKAAVLQCAAPHCRRGLDALQGAWLAVLTMRRRMPEGIEWRRHHRGPAMPRSHLSAAPQPGKPRQLCCGLGRIPAGSITPGRARHSRAVCGEGAPLSALYFNAQTGFSQGIFYVSCIHCMASSVAHAHVAFHLSGPCCMPDHAAASGPLHRFHAARPHRHRWRTARAAVAPIAHNHRILSPHDRRGPHHFACLPCPKSP